MEGNYLYLIMNGISPETSRTLMAGENGNGKELTTVIQELNNFLSPGRISLKSTANLKVRKMKQQYIN